MGKNKLKKFADMERMQCVFQFPFAVVKQEGGCPMRRSGKANLDPSGKNRQHQGYSLLHGFFQSLFFRW